MELTPEWTNRHAGDGELVMNLDFVAPLFVPADRPERFAKAAASGTDAVILDLEDAVAPEAKARARASLRTDFTDLPLVVRINAAGTKWHDEDLAAVARLPLAAVMLPKAEHVADMGRIAAAHPVIALIETARGIEAAREMATCSHVARLAFGSIDFAVDLGCDHAREALAPARWQMVLASRLGGLAAPLDGVTTNFSDLEITLGDARYARGLGFGGKMAIHPRQVAAIIDGFCPDEAEVSWARRVLAGVDGAVAVEGAMVDAPVRDRARAVLKRLAHLNARGQSDGCSAR